jgi:hypothetical protein
MNMAYLPASSGGPITPQNVSSPQAVTRKRRLAEVMMQQGSNTSPVGHPLEAFSRAFQGGMAGYMASKADKEETAGRAGYSSRLAQALASKDSPDLAASMELANDPWASEPGSRLLSTMMQQQLEKQQPNYRTFTNKAGDVMRYNENDPNSQPEMFYDDPTGSDPDWQYMEPQYDAWGNQTQPGGFYNKNSSDMPGMPQGTQSPQHYQSQSLPSGGVSTPSTYGSANPSMLGAGAASQRQGAAPNIQALAQQWLPGVSAKVIMGNADAQEFLISKATNPNDARDFDTWDRDRRKSGASSVTVDNKGLSAEEESAGKERGARMDALESGKSISSLQQIQLAGRLLQNVDSGALAGMKGKAGNIFASLGLPVENLKYLGIDPELVTTGPQIQALVNRQVVGMIGSGQFPAQNFSDTDRIFLEQILPSLSNQPQANALITATTERLLQIEVQKRQAWTQARKQKSSYRDFEADWNDKLQGLDLFGDIAKQAGAAADPSAMSDDDLLRALGGQ